MAAVGAAALACFCSIYVAGAVRARPDTHLTQPDLSILEKWQRAGAIADFTAPAGHLAKPGYLLLLWYALPSRGASPLDLRRFVVGQALLVALTTVLLYFQVARLAGHRRAIALLLLYLLCLPLRDACDYVMTEAIAIAFTGAVAAWLAGQNLRVTAAAGLGAALALFSLVRPNICYILLLVGLLVLATKGAHLQALALGVGALVAAFGLILVGHLSGLPLNPARIDSSQGLLFGTAEYCWPHDLGPLPAGRTPQETAALNRAATAERWRAWLRSTPPDRTRSLSWRATHALLSAEALPSRWLYPAYLTIDKGIRGWWWIGMLGIVAAAIACAFGGSGPWRFVALLTLVLGAIQGVLVGADPRYVLPLWPLVFLGIVLALPRVRSGRTMPWMAGLAGSTLLLAGLLIAPDAACSDYVAIRRPGPEIRQWVPSARVPLGDIVTVHLRLLLSPGTGLGFVVYANGRPVASHDPQDAAPTPAYLQFLLTRDDLLQARRDGLSLRVDVRGSPRTDRTLYYPVVPRALGGASSIDGLDALPSAFGGAATGGLPVWLHAGRDRLPSAPPPADSRYWGA